MCVRTDLETLKSEVLTKRYEVKEDRTKPEQDTLARLTARQRRLLQVANTKLKGLQQTHAYKILFGTTQPAHVIALLAVSFVASTILKPSSISTSPSPYTNLIYLAAISVHFGAQFWMTFVSGLALYFSLPRHAFGAVQKVLFPKYFSLNSLLSLITLITYSRLSRQSTWEFDNTLQTWVLSTCFMLELLIRLYIVPPVLHLISVKTEIEAAAGVGQEVGYCDPGPLQYCPHYKQMHSQFRRLHMAVAVGNIVTMACSAIHLHSIAYQWTCVSNIER